MLAFCLSLDTFFSVKWTGLLGTVIYCFIHTSLYGTFSGKYGGVHKQFQAGLFFFSFPACVFCEMPVSHYKTGR